MKKKLSPRPFLSESFFLSLFHLEGVTLHRFVMRTASQYYTMMEQ